MTAKFSRFGLLLALLVPAIALPQVRVGERAPDFSLRDQNGKLVRLSAARGEKVVLVFYRGHW